MDAAEVEAKVINVIIRRLGADRNDVTPDAYLVDDLGRGDSLRLVELAMDAEETFGIEIPDDDAARILTVGDAVRYVQARVR